VKVPKWLQDYRKGHGLPPERGTFYLFHENGCGIFEKGKCDCIPSAVRMDISLADPNVFG
jgi:hypothetical protein